MTKVRIRSSGVGPDARKLVRAKVQRCTLCGLRSAAFKSVRGRPGSRCPHCGSLERHRLMAMALMGLLPRIVRPLGHVLHVAPEPQIARLLVPCASYRTLDVSPRAKPNIVADICATGLPDASVDLVVACAVLEHVRDPQAAVDELARILSPLGAALLMVPDDGGDKTFKIAPAQTISRHHWHVGRDWALRFYGGGSWEIEGYRGHPGIARYGCGDHYAGFVHVLWRRA